MYISYFLKNIKEFARVKSMTEFVDKLFLAAGSKLFIIIKDGVASSKRQLFYYEGGKKGRPLSKDMKNSFPRPINEKELTIFFDTYIDGGDTQIAKLMDKFGIVTNESLEIENDKKRQCFINALCLQWQEFISNTENDVDNVIPSEYQKCIEQNYNLHDRFVSVIERMERENLMSDLENIHVVNPLIEPLLDFIRRKKFTMDNTFPAQIFHDMKAVTDLISSLEFSNEEVSRRIKNFQVQQARLVDFLENVSFLRYDGYVIECLAPSWNKERSKRRSYIDVDYVIEALEKKQKAYCSSAEELLDLESDLTAQSKKLM